MMGIGEKKPQSKQNINPVVFPPIPLLCYGESTVFWYLDRAPKQAEAFPIGDKPKAKWDKRTNGKGHRSGKENEHGIQKYVTGTFSTLPYALTRYISRLRSEHFFAYF